MSDEERSRIERYAKDLSTMSPAEAAAKIARDKAEALGEDLVNAWDPAGTGNPFGETIGFKAWLQNTFDAFGVNLGNTLKAAADEIVQAFSFDVKGWLSKACDQVIEQGFMTAEFKEVILNVAESSKLGGAIMGCVMFIGAYTAAAANVLKASTAEAQYAILKRFRPNLPGIGEVFRAAFIAPETTGKVREIMRKYGYRDEDIDLMFLASYQLYTPDEAFRLWLRGALTEDQLVKRLREHGLTDERVNELKNLYKVIPPIQDILTMVAKEAFEPDQVARYGLDKEFPNEVVPWLEAQGLDQYWQRKYWAAHWTYPSFQQVLEMLHRGYITEGDVEEYMRVIEIPEYWRKLLVKVNYNTYTRVDVRRMHEVGVLTTEDVYQAYRDEGYNHERAVNMTKFTLLYNQGNDKALTRSQVESAYKKGVIRRDDAVEYLKSLGYTAEQAEFIIGYDDYLLTEQLRDERIAMVEDRFKNNLLSEEDSRQYLTTMGLAAERIEQYILTWETKRLASRRKLTKSEVDTFLALGILKPEEYASELKDLGYSDKHIGWFIQAKAIELGE